MEKSSFVSCGSAVSLGLKRCFIANACFSLQIPWDPVSPLCKTTIELLECSSVGTVCHLNGNISSLLQCLPIVVSLLVVS